MSDPTSLIERIEAATGEDAVIYAALVYAQDNSWINIDQYVNAQDWRCHGAFFEAVMTLMPEGLDWRIERNTDIRMGFGAAVFEPGTPGKYPGIRLYSGTTPCLAILPAILRARQAAQSGQAQTEARG